MQQLPRKAGQNNDGKRQNNNEEKLRSEEKGWRRLKQTERCFFSASSLTATLRHAESRRFPNSVKTLQRYSVSPWRLRLSPSIPPSVVARLLPSVRPSDALPVSASLTPLFPSCLPREPIGSAASCSRGQREERQRQQQHEPCVSALLAAGRMEEGGARLPRFGQCHDGSDQRFLFLSSVIRISLRAKFHVTPLYGLLWVVS